LGHGYGVELIMPPITPPSFHPECLPDATDHTMAAIAAGLVFLII